MKVLTVHFSIRNNKDLAKLTFALNMKRLSELPAGVNAIIREFENDEIFIKLMEMGCIPGEEIKVEMIAPLGDPISITVAGYNLSLRLNEAASIFVEEVNTI